MKYHSNITVKSTLHNKLLAQNYDQISTGTRSVLCKSSSEIWSTTLPRAQQVAGPILLQQAQLLSRACFISLLCLVFVLGVSEQKTTQQLNPTLQKPNKHRLHHEKASCTPRTSTIYTTNKASRPCRIAVRVREFAPLPSASRRRLSSAEPRPSDCTTCDVTNSTVGVS